MGGVVAIGVGGMVGGGIFAVLGLAVQLGHGAACGFCAGGRVEAMKLGAADFIRKPFSLAEIRGLAIRVLEREALVEGSRDDYQVLVELIKRHITDRRFGTARETARKAVACDPGQPEAYNLLGALFEIEGDWLESQMFYYADLDVVPTFMPARTNLERTMSWKKSGRIDLGPEDPKITLGDRRGNENGA